MWPISIKVALYEAFVMRGPSLFTQRNVSRVLRAVKQAGVVVRVEIGKNGAISSSPTTRRSLSQRRRSLTQRVGTRPLANGLKYLHSYLDRHGKLRHDFRRQGFKTVPLPGLPGSVELMQAYTNVLDGVTAPRVEIGASRSKPGAVAAASPFI